MDINFGCTQCGKCCHDLRLLLSVREAKTWLARGDEVQVLCEAIPWPGEPSAADLPAAYKRKLSFSVRSGSMPARVIVTLAASFQGPCPNLRSGMQCAVYEDRPRVCRVYPAEINPFTPLLPANKGCPPEAWDSTRSPFMRGGVLVDETTGMQITDAMVESLREVGMKQRLCASLGIHSAALSTEGFVVHTPARGLLADALGAATSMRRGEPADQANWLFVSPRPQTLEAFAEIGADAVTPDVAQVEYLDLRPAA